MSRKSNSFKFQVAGREALISAKPIKGSPCWMVQEFYACADAPTGYYLTGSPAYIPAADAQSAAIEFVRDNIGNSR